MMTPDKKPFFAATYIPRDGRFGQTGMLQLIPKIGQLWRTNRDSLLKSATEVTALMQSRTESGPGHDLGIPILRSAYQELANAYDERNGGFGRAPKFPSPHELLFLLHYWKRTGDSMALKMAETTLQKMRMGGIYDHVGFGFHRYSTDAAWRVPHFEKMLYDQAMLAMAYTEAYQATHNEQYRATSKEILAYVLQGMTSPAGVFYSAEDADSEGKEGKFYLWKADEIRATLTREESDLTLRLFGITEKGHPGESVENILFLQKGLEESARELKLSPADLAKQLDAIRAKLFSAREKRVHPFRDDKILTDWNGLMIAAFSKAAQVFSEPSYADTARRAADFLLKTMTQPEGGLLHRYRDGQASVPATIDDYAFLSWGLIELYEASFEPRYLRAAIDLNSTLIQHFWDQKSGGFFFTADNAENLLVRQREVYDGAIPSGNSVAALNLMRLGRLTSNPEDEKKVSEMARAFASEVEQSPSGYAQFLIAIDYAVGPSYEVVIAGDSKAADTRQMLRGLQSRYFPNKVVLLHPMEMENPEIVTLAPFARYQKSVEGKATAYVCLNYACKTPTTSVDQMLALLK